MNQDNNLGDLVIIGALGSFILAPFLLVKYIVNKRGLLLTKFRFLLFNSSLYEETPPLNKVQADIFRQGLEQAVKNASVMQSTIKEIKTNVKKQNN